MYVHLFGSCAVCDDRHRGDVLTWSTQGGLLHVTPISVCSRNTSKTDKPTVVLQVASPPNSLLLVSCFM